MGPRRRALTAAGPTPARPQRQSVTIDGDTRAFLNRLRGGVLAGAGVELDFTSCLNAIARVGMESIRYRSFTEREWTVLCEYLRDYPRSRYPSENREWISEFARSKLPRLVQRLTDLAPADEPWETATEPPDPHALTGALPRRPSAAGSDAPARTDLRTGPGLGHAPDPRRFRLRPDRD